MGIQSSVNQGLGTVAMGMGLWAHSPGGKKYLETKQLKREAELAAKKYEEAPEGTAGSDVQIAKDRLYDVAREREIAYSKVAPNAPSLSGNGETAAQRAVAIEEEIAGEQNTQLEAEKKARMEAEERDIKNIRTQEFMNKVLSGTPSEYILQQQKGGTK